MRSFESQKRIAKHYAVRLQSHGWTALRRWMPVPHRARSMPGDADGRRHWVLCFYGIDRSLRYTARGILRHVLAPLAAEGIAVTVVAHFNRIQHIQGGWSKERGVDFRRDQIGLLNPDLLWMEPQRTASIELEMEALQAIEYDSYETDPPRYATAKRNLLHQLHSLSRVRELLRLTGLDQAGRADVIAVMRADLQFLDDLDVQDIHATLTSGECDLITPDWERWGGLNDRFAFLGPRALDPILGRRALAGEFGQRHGYIHAEQLLAFAADRAGLKLGQTSMRAERVRGTGRTAFERFDPDPDLRPLFD